MTKKPSKKKQSKKISPYLKYSGMAFQMLATILIGVGIGYFLDNQFDTGKIFTAVFALIFVVASMYITLKDFIKK